MILKDAQELATTLMVKYHLQDYGYHFEFDNSVSRFGYCDNTNKIISISANLVARNEDHQVKDTILHEIAHALTPGCAHNDIWVRVAKAIGANGQRCYDDFIVETPVHKWTAHCPSCGFELQRHKKNPRLHCAKCHVKTGRFSKANKFKWSKNI